MSSRLYTVAVVILEGFDTMKANTRRWYQLVGPILGVLVMLAGLALLVFTHDAASGYSFLGVGAVIVGTSGLGVRRGGKSDMAG